jgi:tRNA (guanine-N7-)-methyltransferase
MQPTAGPLAPAPPVQAIAMARSSRVPAELLRSYLLDAPHPRTPQWRELAQKASPISWSDVFAASGPVEIEVGFGKGLFLLNQSQARPHVNFLGIEIERKYVMLAAARLARAGVRNVRLACTDARWFLQARIPEASVQVVHIYFPDPWWKQRHRKRKLFTEEFAARCVRVLARDGQIHFATDVADYFEAGRAILNAQPALRATPERTLPQGESLTHFERKYQEEGRTIYRACYTKHAASAL